MTTVGVMQPYFLPHFAYFKLIANVDTFVLYDDVQFIKGGWINRNFIQIEKTPHRISLPLAHASPNRLISETQLVGDHRKLRRTMEMAYARAPYFDQGMEVVSRILTCEETNLARFVENSIRVVTETLGIRTPLLSSSSLEYDREPGGETRLINLCKSLGATSYINSAGGIGLYDPQTFIRSGIELQFAKWDQPAYPQFGKEFISGLSIIDAFMFNPRETISQWIEADGAR